MGIGSKLRNAAKKTKDKVKKSDTYQKVREEYDQIEDQTKRNLKKLEDRVEDFIDDHFLKKTSASPEPEAQSKDTANSKDSNTEEGENTISSEPSEASVVGETTPQEEL